MSRRTLIGSATIMAVVVVLFVLPTREVVSQTIREVFVTNFPDLWTVEGVVDLGEPVHLSEFHAFREVVVPPVAREDTTGLVTGGILETNGFPAVVLSLHGIVRGDVKKPGTVGAILIPIEPTIEEAFNEQGVFHFALETLSTGVSSRTPYFASTQPLYTVGFTRYRVLFYNTTDKTVTANLFAYLTNNAR